MSRSSWFSKCLVAWYAEGHRDLPWRRTTDPYAIWISEVVLQQTRVDQGLGHYLRFMERFPTVRHLAEADEDAVLRQWQGLGYYSRARNLHAAARMVMQEHGGSLPKTHRELLAMKGIGAYTASAISSIAFDLPTAVVDGNVYRVLSRVFMIDTPVDSSAGKREFQELADSLMPTSLPGKHNQAVMELGATICTPRDPRCAICPLAHRCAGRKADAVMRLPVKSGRTHLRDRYFNFAILRNNDGIVLHKRGTNDIWAGLYEPPLLESASALGPKAFLEHWTTAIGMGPWRVEDRFVAPRHLLSHQRIFATFWVLETPGSVLLEKWLVVPYAAVDGHALPRLVQRHMHRYLNGHTLAP